MQRRIFARRLIGSSFKYCWIPSFSFGLFILFLQRPMHLKHWPCVSLIMEIIIFLKSHSILSTSFDSKEPVKRKKRLSSCKDMKDLSVRSSGRERDAPDQNALGVSQEGQEHWVCNKRGALQQPLSSLWQSGSLTWHAGKWRGKLF